MRSPGDLGRDSAEKWNNRVVAQHDGQREDVSTVDRRMPAKA